MDFRINIVASPELAYWVLDFSLKQNLPITSHEPQHLEVGNIQYRLRIWNKLEDPAQHARTTRISTSSSAVTIHKRNCRSSLYYFYISTSSCRYKQTTKVVVPELVRGDSGLHLLMRGLQKLDSHGKFYKCHQHLYIMFANSARSSSLTLISIGTSSAIKSRIDN